MTSCWEKRSSYNYIPQRSIFKKHLNETKVCVVRYGHPICDVNHLEIEAGDHLRSGGVQDQPGQHNTLTSQNKPTKYAYIL